MTQDIGDDVKIVGEKLLEYCDLTSDMAVVGNFWYRAATNVRENAKGMFNPSEVEYMNAKWVEASRKFFAGLVIDTVSSGNVADNAYKLPRLKNEDEAAKEHTEYESKKDAEKQKIKDEFELRKYKESLTNKEEMERYDRERRYALGAQNSNFSPLNQRR